MTRSEGKMSNDESPETLNAEAGSLRAVSAVVTHIRHLTHQAVTAATCQAQAFDEIAAR